MPRQGAVSLGRAVRRPEDIYKTDAKVRELVPHDAFLGNWLDQARAHIKFQGLPARICWLGLGDRHRVGLAFNEMVARGDLKAPVVIGRESYGFRFRRLADARNRSYARWLRCGV